MHSAVIEHVEKHIPDPPAQMVVEFGSRNINGSVRHLFPSAKFIGVDPQAGPDVDIVADASDPNIPTRLADWPAADVVVCAEVFEHAPDEQVTGMLRNAFDLLKAGGVFIATMAGPGRAPHSAIDEAPIRPEEFYRNIDMGTMGQWLHDAGFERVECDYVPFDTRCVARKPLEVVLPSESE